MSELTHSNRVTSPVAAPTVTKELSENVILTCVDDLYDWARLSTLYPLMYGTACCFMEFIGSYGPRFDLERFGAAPRATPRQADLIITAGTITMKYAQPWCDCMSKCLSPNMCCNGRLHNHGGPV